jgi:hypothetical protein
MAEVKTEAVGYVNMLTFLICISILEFIAVVAFVVIIVVKAFAFIIPWSVTFVGLTIIIAMTCYSINLFKTVLNDMKENVTKPIDLTTCPEYFIRKTDGKCQNLFTNPYDPTEQYRIGQYDDLIVNLEDKTLSLCGPLATAKSYAWSELQSKCMFINLTGAVPKK